MPPLSTKRAITCYLSVILTRTGSLDLFDLFLLNVSWDVFHNYSSWRNCR